MARASKSSNNIHPAARPFLWLASPVVKKYFILLPLFGVIFFTYLGSVYPKAHKAAEPWGSFFSSYALIGFGAYSLVVLASWPLFKLLSRPESYYGEEKEENCHD